MPSRAPQSSARATTPSSTLPAWQGRALTSLIMGAALVGALLAPHASPAAWNAREGGIEACLNALSDRTDLDGRQLIPSSVTVGEGTFSAQIQAVRTSAAGFNRGEPVTLTCTVRGSHVQVTDRPS
ncbi:MULTISPECIES: hypothetical protein [Deinococcus]|uniref:Uncharacterized protein n=2 Tax=Deinococcus soli (ex Cha et al. 2016) TaxID=1309411 RepID=A0AAE3X9T1_9DEIO|nr:MULTISPECIES: hypothetical protein [Deinococcus]MDK2013920.1 hypothetical protein [Deinococcus sp. 43]MDR6217740.1 hypothetical protein [Deinococcus soli (ex Cha et al. 2016)]MDR6327990.1 hypothetical protein [Deinococcus soli (ex Cha et al. 2016)]MDR6750842.1 hypothetical protein [Deinococcus soli (ex Cha et al. 2016)]GGB78313.1 hypothetical protein GCM10008019_38210 [Deinococcus soli (ex Cha et al. 2016)]